MRREAADYAVTVRAHIDALAPIGALEGWLGKLGLLVAGNMPAGDARAKLGAYARMLRVPECLLTVAALDAAGREFKWFPSYAEITGFFDRRTDELRARADRAEQIGRLQIAPPVVVRDAPEMSPEERNRRADQIMAAYRRAHGDVA